MKGRVAVVGVLSLAVLGALPSASAELRRSDDRRVSVRAYESAGKVEPDRMAFLWERELPPNAVSFTIEAMCTRARMEPFEFLGNNKILYTDVEMIGRDSGNQLSLKNRTIKLRNGVAANPLWDVSADVRTSFPGDSIVKISATVIWNGKVGAGDVISCVLRMLEGGAGV